jgi:parvulin-like peptidyl-prolyl isomerase
VAQRFSSKLDLPDPGRPRFPWRIGIYSIVLGYLLVDLFLVHGPLRRRLDASTPGSPAAHSAARKHQWVARVNGTPITIAQLNRAIEVSNYKRGVNASKLTPQNRKINRIAALGELIDDQIIASYARNHPAPVSDERIDAELDRFKQQFSDDDELLVHLEEQQIDPQQLRTHIAEHVRQIAYLENRIAPSIIVTDEEARDWFKENQGSARIPERVRARHIFLSHLPARTDYDEPELPAEVNQTAPVPNVPPLPPSPTAFPSPLSAEDRIKAIHQKLLSGDASFDKLARLYSEDERTKGTGGDLDYFSRLRLPEDFTTPTFALKVGEISSPFQSSIGWHIVEVTDRKPPRDPTFEETQDEILALLESHKRDVIIDRVLESMKLGSIIEYFPKNLFPKSPLPKPDQNPQ